MNTIKFLKVMMGVGVASVGALTAGCVGSEADEGAQAEVEQSALASGDAYSCGPAKFMSVQDLKVETPNGAVAPGETATVTATVVQAKNGKFMSYPGAWLKGDYESSVEQEFAFSNRYGVGPGQSFEVKWQVTVKKSAKVGSTTTLTASGGTINTERCNGAPEFTFKIPIAAH